MNCAMTADGKISSVARRQVRISSPEDMERVRTLRAGSDAILVGVGTVLAMVVFSAAIGQLGRMAGVRGARFSRGLMISCALVALGVGGGHGVPACAGCRGACVDSSFV